MDTQSQAEKKRALSEKPEVLRLVDTLHGRSVTIVLSCTLLIVCILKTS